MKILIALPALLLAHRAFFADFTFNVPVNIQAYTQPAAYSAPAQAIYCVVINGTTEIGVGHTAITIPASGNLNTTVTVAVNMISGNHASDAQSYRCYLLIATGVTAANAVSRGELHARPGTTPVLLVSGTIPH